MQCIRALIVVLVLGSVLHAGKRDVKSTFDLIKKGHALSARDAAKLEDRLEKKPTDEEARIQLLSYYAGPPAGADLSAVKAARARHVLWLIENDPSNGFGLFQIATGVYHLHCQGDDLADPETFERVSRKWVEQVQKNPENQEIRQTAVDEIRYCSPERAEEILAAAKDASGRGRLYHFGY
jgi:hypothetical protein